MAQDKVIEDWLIATQETIYTLQVFQGWLERWRTVDDVEPADFGAAWLELEEAGLGAWARQAGGHGLAALARAVGVEPEERPEPFEGRWPARYRQE